MCRQREIFKRITIYTLLLVYVLIYVGGFVRSSGAGMGCPDWPKCFGQWIPPTSTNELPENYRELFLKRRIKKVNRLVNTLSFLGLKDLGNSIKNDPNIRKEELFNSRKTWIEYINRLVGVFVGIMSIFLVISSRNQGKQLRISVLILFLVIVEGLIGSLMVVTNLLPWVISIHTLLALVILLLLTFQLFVLNKNKIIEATSANELENHQAKDSLIYFKRRKKLKFHFMILMLFYLFQLFSGIWVREHIDTFSFVPTLGKGEYLDSIGILFYIHRSFSILLLFYQLYFLWYYFKAIKVKGSVFSNLLTDIDCRSLAFTWLLLCGLTVIEILSGAILYYFALPFLIQPLHLLLSFILLNLVFYIYLCESLMVKYLLSRFTIVSH